jgi:acyl-CoA thioesterase-2
MSSLAGLLDVFDVQQVGEGTYTGDSDGGTRAVVDGSQLMAQAVVAAGKTFPEKSVRSAYASFLRAAAPDVPLTFEVATVHAGRTFANTVVTVRQGDRTCSVVHVLLDVPQADVIRHAAPMPRPSTPDQALPVEMPLTGRELRLVDVADPNAAAEVGPPLLDAWLRYDVVPDRDELRKALLAHFTGHLSISASMRGHAGIGTEMAHHTVSTAVTTIDVTFHEPVTWDGWLAYAHDSTFAGAGTSYVRGQVFTETGALIASFSQQGMIRHFAPQSASATMPVAARL